MPDRDRRDRVPEDLGEAEAVEGAAGGDVRARDRGAARAAVGLEHVAVEPERPLAERLEVAHRAQGAADQPLDLDRPPLLAARCAPRAAVRSPGRGREAASTRRSSSPRRVPTSSAGRPRRPSPCRARSSCPAPRARAVRLLEEVRRHLERPQLAGPPPVRPAHAAARSRSASVTCSTSPIGSWRKRAPISRNCSGSPVVRNRYEPSRALGVLDALARERLGHLARRLLRREDEGDAAAEDALEDRADQRVVGAAEDDGVDAGGAERLGVLAHGVRRLLAERVVALDQRHEPRACDRGQAHPGVESADELGVAARVAPSPAWPAGRHGGCASPGRPRAPPA